MENFNAYVFTFTNSNTTDYYYDSINITSYFLLTKLTTANVLGTHTLANIKLSNIRPNGTGAITIFYSDKGGSYSIINLEYQTKP